MLERSGGTAPRLSAEALKRTFRAQLESVRRFVSTRRDMSMLEVDYNQLLAGPLPEAARVAEFLGLGDVAAKMAAAVDPSLYRNRQQ
jgi:hypothetical protein